MNPFGISQKSYLLILPVFTKYAEIDEVILFGSRAKGNYRNTSDIDLAIKGEGCTDMLALEIEAYINEELPVPYYVDVINYNGVHNQDLKEHINRVGKTFYTSGQEYLVNDTDNKYRVNQKNEDAT